MKNNECYLNFIFMHHGLWLITQNLKLNRDRGTLGMVSRLRGNDSPGAGWSFRTLAQIYVVAYLENAALGTYNFTKFTIM